MNFLGSQSEEDSDLLLIQDQQCILGRSIGSKSLKLTARKFALENGPAVPTGSSGKKSSSEARKGFRG